MLKMCAICGTVINDRVVHYTTNGIFIHSVYTDEKGFERQCYKEYEERILKEAYSIDNIRRAGW